MKLTFKNFSLTCLLLMYTLSAGAVRYMPEKEKPCPCPVARPSAQRVWQPKVPDMATWQQLAKPVRNYEYGKFVIDLKTHQIYFTDSHVFTLHIDFVLDYLQKLPRTSANVKAYNRNYSTQKPQFVLGYLTRYPDQHEWVFSFWEGDAITAKQIASTYKMLNATFTVPAAENATLKFRPDSSAQEKVAQQLGAYNIPVMSNDALYQASPFQAWNTGKTIGRLVVVPANTPPENLHFAPDDIVLLQSNYPDISPVAGMITTQFSTPLSHINLRATAWGIPNATIKTAYQDFNALNGKVVHYEVSDTRHTLRVATPDEIKQHQAAQTARTQIDLPKADLSQNQLRLLAEISAEDVGAYGAKTSNLGEILRANRNIAVPNGFGIPFGFYVRHITQNKLDANINAMLQDPRFKQDATWRKVQLTQMREAILNAPMNAADFAKIVKQWKTALKGKGVFVRSSTNAEDLKGFNGAGLYDTVPNVTEEKALEQAIKQVWASLWNVRAVDERAYFGIAHTQIYPAVLVQTAVNAKAAGVLLTTDIWGYQPRTYTINAKWGLGMRVVEGKKVAEQILFDLGNDGTRVISRSDESTMLVTDPKGGTREISVPQGKAILTEARAKALAQEAEKVSEIFNQVELLDIEWVLETQAGQDRFWIVQARPYVQNKKTP